MLVCGDSVESTCRGKVGQLISQFFAQPGPERHILSRWHGRVERHSCANNRQPFACCKVIQYGLREVRDILGRHVRLDASDSKFGSCPNLKILASRCAETADVFWPGDLCSRAATIIGPTNSN